MTLGSICVIHLRRFTLVNRDLKSRRGSAAADDASDPRTRSYVAYAISGLSFGFLRGDLRSDSVSEFRYRCDPIVSPNRNARGGAMVTSVAELRPVSIRASVRFSI